MKDVIVSVDGMDMKSIVDIQFHKKVNEHGSAVVKCIVDDEAVENLLKIREDATWVAIKIGEEGSQTADTTVFAGIISEISVDNQRGASEAEMKLVGGSILLDLKPNTRTYQKEESKLSNIINYIKEHKNNKITGADLKVNCGKGCKDSYKPEEDLLVQYEETNYEFLKRCASMQGVPLITSIDQADTPVIRIDMGLVAKSGNDLETKYFKREKQLKEYMLAKKHGLTDVTENDYNVIEVKTHEYFNIGDMVNIAGKSMYVYAADSVYDSSLNIGKSEYNINKDEFWHTYILASEKRFSEAIIYNYDIIGASLQADVKEVVGDKIKLEVLIDKENKVTAKDNIEFPFSTVYSTNDGTGWYCMPEEKDRVRLYFPTEKEKDAYVISAVHLEENNKLRNDPEKKFIMNKYKKMVQFTKDAITITNNDGMTIELNDSKGISIISDKDINMSAGKDVNITSKKKEVNVSGKSSVNVKQGSSAYIELKGTATIKGTQVKM